MEERSEQFECSYCGSKIQLSKRGRSGMNRVAPIGKLNVASLPNLVFTEFTRNISASSGEVYGLFNSGD